MGATVRHSDGRTSCGRTSGRACCTPRPAAAAPRPRSSRRWTPPGGCGWAAGRGVSGKQPALPFNSRLPHRRERPHRAGGYPRCLAQKEEPKDWGTRGVCAERNSELLGMVKGHLSLQAPRRGAGTLSYLLSPRSRVLSFMRAVRAYPRVAGRDIWDCSTFSSSANTSSSFTFAGTQAVTVGHLASPAQALLRELVMLASPEGARFPHSSPPAGGPRILQCTRLPLAPVAAAWDKKDARPGSGSPPHFHAL